MDTNSANNLDALLAFQVPIASSQNPDHNRNLNQHQLAPRVQLESLEASKLLLVSSGKPIYLAKVSSNRAVAGSRPAARRQPKSGRLSMVVRLVSWHRRATTTT